MYSKHYKKAITQKEIHLKSRFKYLIKSNKKNEFLSDKKLETLTDSKSFF